MTTGQDSQIRIDVLTTFPEMFAASAPGALATSIPGRARAAGLLDLRAVNIRDYTTDRHQKTDDRPFGGGPGMVMTPQPVWDAVRAVEGDGPTPQRIHMTPQGIPLDQKLVADLAARRRLLILAGHYEGIDQRVIDRLDPLEISIGDYVLSGGELAAMVLIDAIVRLLPGALGHEHAAAQDSFAPAPGTDPIGNAVPEQALEALGLRAGVRLLDCPHYTRPRVWEGRAVPEVLLSGDHQAVARWRLEQMVERTRRRRPDLLA